MNTAGQIELGTVHGNPEPLSSVGPRGGNIIEVCKLSLSIDGLSAFHPVFPWEDAVRLRAARF